MKKLKRNTLQTVLNPFKLRRIILEVPYEDEFGTRKIQKYKTWSIVHEKSDKPLVYGKFSELVTKMGPLRRKGSEILGAFL